MRSKQARSSLKAQLQQAEVGLEATRHQAEQAKAAVEVARAAIEQARLGVEAVEISVANAQVALEAAQKNYDRAKFLFEHGALAPAQMDEAATKLEQAQNGYTAALKQKEAAQRQYETAEKQYQMAVRQYETASGPGIAAAQAAINTLKVNMSNSVITSPLKGVVVSRNINPGELASPTSPLPLMVIADLSVLKLQGTVREEMVPHLYPGLPVKVTAEALPGKEFSGTITRIGPMAAGTEQRFPIEIEVANPGT